MVPDVKPSPGAQSSGTMMNQCNIIYLASGRVVGNPTQTAPKSSYESGLGRDLPHAHEQRRRGINSHMPVRGGSDSKYIFQCRADIAALRPPRTFHVRGRTQAIEIARCSCGHAYPSVPDRAPSERRGAAKRGGSAGGSDSNFERGGHECPSGDRWIASASLALSPACCFPTPRQYFIPMGRPASGFYAGEQVGVRTPKPETGTKESLQPALVLVVSLETSHRRLRMGYYRYLTQCFSLTIAI